MFTQGWHVYCSYRFRLIGRGQRRQCALCCNPLPFQGQRWCLWAAVPSLGGVLSLLWHFPLTYTSYPADMKDIWET